jgi:hypothetical protein
MRAPLVNEVLVLKAVALHPVLKSHTDSYNARV